MLYNMLMENEELCMVDALSMSIVGCCTSVCINSVWGMGPEVMYEIPPVHLYLFGDDRAPPEYYFGNVVSTDCDAILGISPEARSLFSK